MGKRTIDIGMDTEIEQIEIYTEYLMDYFDTESVSWKIQGNYFEINNITINKIKFDDIKLSECSLHFKECTFNCEIINYPYYQSIKKSIFFIHCTFIKHVNFYNLEFCSNVYFENSIFEDYADFHECEFEKTASFYGVTFKKTPNFSNSAFKNNVYFNNSIFEDYADFHECEFEKTASFYGVEFKKVPNFSQTQFKGSLNVVNTNLDFYFKSLKNKIKQEHIEYNKRESIKKPLAHFANDFRDSFRIFKSTLIKDNNLLDASNFHKCELYCKEVELDSKKTKTLRDKVDKWQLWFYRKLCDHHTDILKSFHSLMLVIGLFGLVSLGVIVGFDYCLGYKPILSHLYMIKEIYDAHIQSFIKTHTLYTFAFNIFILAFYLVILVCLISVKYLREVFIGVSYFIVISILLISPKILIPAMGIFTDKRVLLDPLSTLGGIYTIVFGFVLFSFIKTIRKNSIVPS
ncbi:pentapeptide repeat-containing protein [Helicobacter pullorum]|nr:pentapeptide repeat-containing protein [Helicobacter pullorum]